MLDKKEIEVKIPENLNIIETTLKDDIFAYSATITGFYAKKNRGKKIVILINKI